MSEDKCEPPFWKNISVLLNFSLQYSPTCEHSKFNFTARLIIVSLIVGLIASIFGGLSFFLVALLFGITTALVIVFTTKDGTGGTGGTGGKGKDEYYEVPYVAPPIGYEAPLGGGFGGGVEGFANGGSTPGSVQPYSEVDAFPYSGPMLPEYTPPTSRNLFMNVLVDQIKYNPDRPPAAPINNPTVKQTIDDYFRVQWFSDPTDVFGKNQSQRQFVTQPSTTVPNDQGAFANWLYKIPGKTCKEGGTCFAGTDGGPVTWLNQKN